MAIGLFAAAFLTDRLPGGILWRAAMYIPVVTSWVVVSFIFAYIFSSQGGIMNAMAGFFTGHTETIPWTAQTWTGNAVIWLIGIWKGVGWSFIIFLAALDGVPRPLLESARIDGATEPRVWRYVVLPVDTPRLHLRAGLAGDRRGAGVHADLPRDPGRPVQLDPGPNALYVHAGVQGLRVRLRGGHGVFAGLVLFGFSVAEIRILRQDV